MKKLFLLSLFIMVILPVAAFPQSSPKSPKQIKIATLIVFDLVPEKGIERGVTNLLTEMIINRVSAMKKYEVIGQKDLEKLLTWEQTKQFRGCTDTKCLIQLAGAMGADYYIEGSVGAIGDQYVVTLKFMDAINVKVLERETIRIIMDETVLADAMERLVDKIMGLKVDLKSLPVSTAAAAASAKQAANAQLAASARLERKSRLKTAGISCTSIGLGFVIVGAVFNAMAVSEIGVENSATDAKTLNDARSQADTYGKVAVAGYAVGGAALVSGIVMWVLGAVEKTEGSKSVEIIPLLGPSGGGVLVGGSF